MSARLWPTLACALVLGALSPAPAGAQRALSKESLVEYIRGRDDLSPKERKRWEAEIRKRFGGAALKEDSDTNVEITVAKAILSSAIFSRADPAKACLAAWEGWRGALGYVPPPIAIYYQIMALEGRQPRGRMIDLAFKFPEYYNEEIAPELVAHWETALKDGKIPDDALAETKEALALTRVKMRPLLLDKLRVMARLARDLGVARGARKAEIEHDMKDLEGELGRSFSGVARRPEVIDPRKRPFDRLRIQLEDLGQPLTEDDRLLNPDAPPPPRREIPTTPSPPPVVAPPDPPPVAPRDPPPATPPVAPRDPPPVAPPLAPKDPVTEPGAPLTEPDAPPPSGPLPAQPRPGDPNPRLDRESGRSLGELSLAYRRRLEGVVDGWIGTPYVWGASSKRSGTDCSGFSRGSMAESFSVDLPRVSRDQFRVGLSVSLEGLKPGDLVFFDIKDVGQVSHVGVYTGDGRFAHASTSKGVMYARLDEKYFRRAYRGARRVLAYPE